MPRSALLIGEVAEAAGLTPKTIRYYEAIGLLPAVPRGENRYRLYAREIIDLLRFIQSAQSLGLSLSEIKEIVALRREGREPCPHVRTLVERKVAGLNKQINDLIVLRRRLRHLLAALRVPRKSERTGAVVCPEIETIAPQS